MLLGTVGQVRDLAHGPLVLSLSLLSLFTLTTCPEKLNYLGKFHNTK